MRKGLKKGFTLIELLVVIAIIAILATVVIINVTGARAKSARAKITSDFSAATKAYSACGSFGGTQTAAPTTGTSTGLIAVCSASAMPSDATEAAAATGLWPLLPTGYMYVTSNTITTGHSTGAATGNAAAGTIGVVEAQQGSAAAGANPYAACTSIGCFTGNNW